ncbi:MAG TPA: hypothetical protein VGC16_05520 [Rhizomicrobium sp.]
MFALVGMAIRGIGRAVFAAIAVLAVLAISAAALVFTLVCAAPLKALQTR